MRSQLLAVNFAIFLAVPALAEEPAGAPSTDKIGTVSLDEAHLNERVCKRMPPKTGSRIPGETICMTNRLWIQLWRDSVHIAHIMQSKPITTNGGALHGEDGG